MRRLVLLEPIRLLREGIAGLLMQCGYDVIERSGLGNPDHHQTADDSIDLVLTEIPGPGCGMAEWLERLRKIYPGAKIVILTSRSNDSTLIESALMHGAMGYVEKDMSSQAIRAIIDAVLHGQIAFPRELRDRFVRHAESPDQTSATSVRRERPTEMRTVEPLPHIALAPIASPPTKIGC